jgi:YfiR/HmsC-like
VRYAQRLRDWSASLGILLLACAPGLTSYAQSVSEDQVKAAYVYNFAKFIAWPSGAFSGPAAPLGFCVLDDRSFEAELTQIIKGKTVGGRAVMVVSVQNGEQSRNCHILFIGSSQAGKIRHIIAAVQNTSVLTVGEIKGFVEDGGIINFVLEDDRVQFQVNHKAAKQAGLSISAKLLAVAKVVVVE